ncbi:A-kinase anchor protein 10, mitochondrial, partial [Galemys pyrenaicus]
ASALRTLKSGPFAEGELSLYHLCFTLTWQKDLPVVLAESRKTKSCCNICHFGPHDSFSRGRKAALQNKASHMEAAHPGDLGRSGLDHQTQKTKPSLPKTLEQNGALVKFWLETQSSHSTTCSQIKAHSLNIQKQISLAEPVSPSKAHETTASFVTESLDKRLEDSSSAQMPMTQSEGTDLNNRTSNTQPLAAFPGILEMTRTEKLPSFHGNPKILFYTYSNHAMEHCSEFLQSHHFCKYLFEPIKTVNQAGTSLQESALFYFSKYMEKKDAVKSLVSG